MTNPTDVAQLVLRATFEEGYRYLLAHRTMDSKWEFIGGKRENGEAIRDAARRELSEELASVSPDDAEILQVGNPYPSTFGPEFMLHPIMMETSGSVANSLDEGDLSSEHDQLEWIQISEFNEYETAGQYQALVELGLVE